MRRLPLPCAIAMLSVFFATIGSAQNEIMGTAPHVQAGTLIVVDPTAGEVREASGVRWGNDVRIFSGSVYHCPVAQRPLAAVADTLGGMYVAVNAVYQDTSSRVLVFRSTTSGQTWSLMKIVYSSTGNPIQAFDMCIADSLDGVFVLTMVLAVQYGASWQGGTLYWLAMHADGTRTRTRTIETGNDNHVFTTPALCTNGDVNAPGKTSHYVAAIRTKAGYTTGRMYVAHTTDWGEQWSDPDTAITGVRMEQPRIAVDCSTTPDSLCLVYSEQGTRHDHLTIACNTHTTTGAWRLLRLDDAVQTKAPSLGIDPSRGNAIVTFIRNGHDAMYMYSTDLFTSHTLDSIGISLGSSAQASITYSPWGTGYYWRVVYIDATTSGKVFFKSVVNRMSGLYSGTASLVNQYSPTAYMTPVVGLEYLPGAGGFQASCVYTGANEQDVYFDATTLHLDVPGEGERPLQTTLTHNFPNPFNPQTSLQVTIVDRRRTIVTVYDVLGKLVASLMDETKDPGTYTVHWDARGMASGVYYIRLTAGTTTVVRKAVLVR